MSLGIVATGGSRSDRLGALSPWVVDGSVAVTLACLRRPALELCVAGRFEAGMVFSSATAARTGIAAARVSAPYLQPSAVVEAAVPIGAATVSIAATAGWAEGLVVLADDREAARMAGPVVAVTVGARFYP